MSNGNVSFWYICDLTCDPPMFTMTYLCSKVIDCNESYHSYVVGKINIGQNEGVGAGQNEGPQKVSSCSKGGGGSKKFTHTKRGV